MKKHITPVPMNVCSHKLQKKKNKKKKKEKKEKETWK